MQLWLDGALAPRILWLDDALAPRILCHAREVAEGGTLAETLVSTCTQAQRPPSPLPLAPSPTACSKVPRGISRLAATIRGQRGRLPWALQGPEMDPPSTWDGAGIWRGSPNP